MSAVGSHRHKCLFYSLNVKDEVVEEHVEEHGPQDAALRHAPLHTHPIRISIANFHSLHSVRQVVADKGAAEFSEQS